MWRRGRNVWEVWGRGWRREEVGARRLRWRSRRAEPSGPKSTLNNLYWASTKHTHALVGHTHFSAPSSGENQHSSVLTGGGLWDRMCQETVSGWKSKCSLLVSLRRILQMEMSEWRAGLSGSADLLNGSQGVFSHMSLAAASSAAPAGFYSCSQTPTVKPQQQETAAEPEPLPLV